MKFTIQTESIINYIDDTTFKQLQKLTKTYKKHMYPSEPVQITGEFDTFIESQKCFTVATILCKTTGRRLSAQQYHGSGVRLDQSPSEQGRHKNESITKGQRNWSLHNQGRKG